MSSFREFSQKSDFLDYVGGERIDRKKSEGQNVTRVDMKNRIPAGGPLLGTWGYFTSPCAYSINTLRKVNDEWFVVWQAGLSMLPEQSFNGLISTFLSYLRKATLLLIPSWDQWECPIAAKRKCYT